MTHLPRRSLEDILPGLTEEAPSEDDLLALSPGERMARLALSVSGIGADLGNEDMRALYLSIVCPERPGFIAQKMYSNVNDWFLMFSCGLVGRSLMRRFGMRAPELGLDPAGTRHPYKSGTTVDNIIVVAKRAGAWRRTGLPGQGAILVIGEGLQTHVRTLTQEVDEDARTLSVDGGQTVGTLMVAGEAKGLQGILSCSDIMMKRGSSYAFGERRLLGYVDPAALESACSVPPTIELL